MRRQTCARWVFAVAMLAAATPGYADDAAVAAAAKEYYARLAEFEALMKPCSERDHAAMWDKSFKPPATATGVVLDLFGRPVAGAEVMITHEASTDDLARGKTDTVGRFDIALGTDAYRGLSIRVTAEGFSPGGYGGIYGGLVNYPVRLVRALDEKRLDAMVSEKDDAPRLRMMLELLNSDLGAFGGGLKAVYPRLGELRADLLAVAQSKAFAAKRERGDRTMADRARSLLVYWCDPADEALVKEWARACAAAAPKEDLSAATIDEVCRKYADAHFGDKQPRTMHVFGEPVLGLDGNHALVTFDVRYANWAYGEHLILVRRDGRWTLKLVIDAWIT